MGLKNLNVFSSRPSRPVSFRGIKGTGPVSDKQTGGECWIEALENLAQLYIPTKYPNQSPMFIRQIVEKSVQNPDAIESQIRYVLVKDFLENKGNKYGYFIDFCSGDKSLKVITASNATAQERQILTQYANNSRAYLQKINPTLTVDDNIGEFTSPVVLNRPHSKAEAVAFPGATAYYRILLNILEIETKCYKFDEKTICSALNQDRPVLFRMNVSGFSRYQRNGRISGGHALLIVDYISTSSGISYVIVDSNVAGTFYTVTSAELVAAAKDHYSFGTGFQLLIPDKSTPWNAVMGV